MGKIVVVLCLIMLALSKKNLKQASKEKNQDHKTVVEANHFYSNYERNTTYEINGIEKNKSLILILKNGGKTDKELKQNPITISLLSGDKSETCTFKSFSNICGIKKVQNENMNMKIQCKTAPCELSWIIYQPPVLSQDGKHGIETFVEVNKDYDHATIIVACNDPNIKTFSKDINLFTNSAYTKVENSGIVYYLFSNEQKGYYYITTENEGARKCANAVLKHSSDQIQLNKKDQVVQDFLLPSKFNQYILKKAPQFDFRMDAFFHTAKGQKLSSKEGLVVSLLGEKGSNKVSLSSVRIEGEDRNSVDFSVIFKKPTQKYDNLVINIEPIGSQILIVNMNFASSQRQQVNIGQSTYFKLNKGQTLSFKLLPETQETSDSKLTHIFSSDDKLFLPSIKECKTKFGCEFSLQAKQTGQGDLYFGEQAQKNISQVIMIDFKDKFTKKMREGEKVYMKTNIKQKQAVQAVVNSPNVIIYAAKKGKCDIVSQQCHEKVLNFHNPIIYESKKDVQVIFVAQALDICQFTLTLINEGSQYIELHDTQPFTYLFDDAQKDLEFRFNLTTKQDVHFNLIAPADQLQLTVYNQQQVPENSEGEISNEGYITFNKDDIHGLSFVVKVSKKEAFLNKYIHFTILVSTKQGNVRLQPGVAQFQTIPSEQSRDYVFQFQPSKQILLNFYTHNLVDADINVIVQVSTTDDYDKQDEINQFTLDSQSDVVDIKQVAKKLCKENAGENCELFVRVINKMEVEIDITVTLMLQETIIELKDGIWGSYQINKVAQNTHFYFLPKNKNRSITILFKSDLVDLKLMYTVWKTDDKSINPSQWPFPTQVKGDNQKSNLLLFFMPTKFIHIDSDSLKNCWPNCVVLISTFKDQNSLKGKYNSYMQQSQFKILASSNYIQVPQKQKIDIVLKKQQSKHLLVDLKYVLDKQALTFFTYFTIGSVKLSGNVYSDSDPRCPVPDEPSDFKFGNLQTQIAMTSVKRRLEQNKMEDDKNPYICILAEAFMDSKFSIQFISDQGLIKQLMLDSFSVHKSDKPENSYFQIDGTQEFTIKITRSSGFPYIDHVICKSGNDFQDCLEKFKTQHNSEVQLADKMTTITQTPCEKCIVFLKIHSDQPYEVNIHVASKYSQAELIQNQQINDELVQKGENKYLITSIKKQEIIINIQIIHGDLQVNVFDFAGVNLTKTNPKGSTNIHIVIPPKDNFNKDNQFGATFLGYYDYSTFTTFHMTIKSQNASATALYTITYSSGDPEIYLQDGLISQYALLSEKATKFLYKNPTLSKIYLHISMTDGQLLNKLKVKITAINNENDEDSGVQITPQTPNFKKKTANPTIIMHLPANKFFLIEITNPSKDIQLITLGVNNQQIIYLPFNHELPVQLGKGDHTYLVINVPFESYLTVTIKKCDEGNLGVAYTTSYDEFVKEEFSYEQVIGQEELITELMIKTKKTGSAYIKIQSPLDQDSLVTVKATYSFFKTKADKTKAGNKGVVEYKVTEAPNYELSFSPLNCPTSDKNCSKDFTYSSITSGKVQDIYAQLVCDSVAFDLEDRKIITPITPAPITSPAKDGKITMQHKLAGNSQYIGIKAINSKTGEVVYYRSVQLSTIWGQISKGSKSLRTVLIIFFSIFLLCSTLICYRRRKRNMYEYTPLQGLD